MSQWSDEELLYMAQRLLAMEAGEIAASARNVSDVWALKQLLIRAARLEIIRLERKS